MFDVSWNQLKAVSNRLNRQLTSTSEAFSWELKMCAGYSHRLPQFSVLLLQDQTAKLEESQGLTSGPPDCLASHSTLAGFDDRKNQCEEGISYRPAK